MLNLKKARLVEHRMKLEDLKGDTCFSEDECTQTANNHRKSEAEVAEAILKCRLLEKQVRQL